MGEFWNVVVLAVLQGVAEFLPISSSGHLVLAQSLLEMNKPGMRLEVVLHLGTLFSIFFFYRFVFSSLIWGLFRRDRASWRLLGCILLSAVPAALFYFLFQDWVDAFFENVHAVGWALIGTGLVLTSLRWIRSGTKPLTYGRALLAGLAQAVAILPGVSRSGSTIAAARMSGLDPEKAAEFSFIMSTPLLLGGAFLDFLGCTGSSGEEQLSVGLLLLGAAVSTVVGYFSLAWLVRLLKSGRFWLFGLYCVLAGTLTLCFL